MKPFLALLLCFQLTSVFAQLDSINCVEESLAPVSEEKLQELCQAAVQKGVCSTVPPEDMRSCTEPDTEVMSGWDVLRNCGTGVVKSVKDMLAFLAEAATFSWDMLTHGKKYDESIDFAVSMRLFIITEYDKAYQNASEPKAMLAAAAVSGKVMTQLMRKLTQAFENSSSRFSCLNSHARTKKVCETMTTLLVPPAGFFAFLKIGNLAVKSFPHLHRVSKLLEDTKVKVHPTSLNNFDREQLLISFKNGICKGKKNVDRCAEENFNTINWIARGEGRFKAHRALIDNLVQGKVLLQKLPEMERSLLDKGFVKISSCVKAFGPKQECLTFKEGPLAGKEVPQIMYVHPTGVSLRVKPMGVPEGVRRQPHMSLFISKADHEFIRDFQRLNHSDSQTLRTFADQRMGWSQELAKIDPGTGVLLPKHPDQINLQGITDPAVREQYKDKIMSQAHPNLN